MRKIGLIGGMSWIATARYYRILNEEVARRSGALSSAPILMDSLDFAYIGRALSTDDWTRVSAILVESARRLASAGAEGIALCANSGHRVYDDIAAAVEIPVIHIADCIAADMKKDGMKSAALIGPRNVMTERWYRQRLVKHNITLSPPDMDRVEEIDRIIYEELVFGKASREAERTMKTFITDIEKLGVDAVILGATELSLVVDTKANVLPIYDTTEVHAESIVRWMFGEEPLAA